MFRSGFFNSNNHDKQYYASDISKLFDSLINPGVFGNVGDKFIVRPGTGMQVIVPSGLAWFNSTWTVNDADELINLDEAPYVANYKRIDTIYLKIYPVNNVTVRDNTAYYAKGIETNGTPEASVPVSTDGEIYVPLCYISVDYNTTNITASMIRNRVGTSECPFITGILQTVDAGELLAQWESQWNDWLNGKTANFNSWFANKETEFENWFNNLKTVLDGDVAGHLQNEIDDAVTQLEEVQFKSDIVKRNIAPSEPTSISDAKYTSGGYFFVDEDRKLYKALVDINKGDAISPGVNAEETTIAQVLQALERKQDSQVQLNGVHVNTINFTLNGTTLDITTT